MQDTELIIKRYIRKQLSKLKPRDKDFVIKYLNEQIDSTYDEALEEFYKRHMVGFDVFKILEEDSFYQDVPYFKLPNHIKVKPAISYPKKLEEEIDSQFYEFDILNRGNVFARPSHIVGIEAQRNYLKRIFNKIVKRYITGKTYKSWINKNASKLSLDELFDIKASYHDDSEGNGYEFTIENFLKQFKENKKIDEAEYDRFFKLIFDFFDGQVNSPLKKAIFIKKGCTKKIASALGGIYREIKSEKITYEYLMLGKENVNIFLKEKFTDKNFQKSNLYKYYTSKSLK
jgi:hypothetical protein